MATTVVGVLRLRKDFKLTMASHGAALAYLVVDRVGLGENARNGNNGD